MDAEMLPVVKLKRPGQKNRVYDTKTCISWNPAGMHLETCCEVVSTFETE